MGLTDREWFERLSGEAAEAVVLINENLKDFHIDPAKFPPNGLELRIGLSKKTQITVWMSWSKIEWKHAYDMTPGGIIHSDISDGTQERLPANIQILPWEVRSLIKQAEEYAVVAHNHVTREKGDDNVRTNESQDTRADAEVSDTDSEPDGGVLPESDA